MLSSTRDMRAAQRFFRSAQSMVNSAPKQVTTDGHDSYPRAIRETRGPKVEHRCSAYRGVKQRFTSTFDPAATGIAVPRSITSYIRNFKPKADFIHLVPPSSDSLVTNR
jgi:transposase-like protein